MSAEFVSISTSSFDPAALAAQLTEHSAQGWSVVSIVPTGGDVTAFLTREAAAGEAEVWIARINPVYPILEGTKITPTRLAKGLQLTSFTVMLWLLAGIDEKAY